MRVMNARAQLTFSFGSGHQIVEECSPHLVGLSASVSLI